MEPITTIVSLSAGITAVVGRVFSAGKAIKDLKDAWTNVPNTLRLLQTECCAVGTVLQLLTLECERYKLREKGPLEAVIPLEYIENEIIATGDTLLDLEEWLREIKSEGKTRKRDAIRTVWDEGKIDVMLKHLGFHKSSLNLHISMLQLSMTAAAETRIAQVEATIDCLAKNSNEHVRLNKQTEISTELGSSFSTGTDYTRFSFDSEVLKSTAYKRLGISKAPLKTVIEDSKDSEHWKWEEDDDSSTLRSVRSHKMQNSSDDHDAPLRHPRVFERLAHSASLRILRRKDAREPSAAQGKLELSGAERFQAASEYHKQGDLQKVLALYPEDPTKYNFDNSDECSGFILSCYSRLVHADSPTTAADYISLQLATMISLGSTASRYSWGQIPKLITELRAVLAFAHLLRRSFDDCQTVIASIKSQDPTSTYSDKSRRKTLLTLDHEQIMTRCMIFKLEVEISNFLSTKNDLNTKYYGINIIALTIGNPPSLSACSSSSCTSMHEQRNGTQIRCHFYENARIFLKRMLLPRTPSTESDYIQMIRLEIIIEAQIESFETQSRRNWRQTEIEFCLLTHADLLIQIAMFLTFTPEIANSSKTNAEGFLQKVKSLYFSSQHGDVIFRKSRDGDELEQIYGRRSSCGILVPEHLRKYFSALKEGPLKGLNLWFENVKLSNYCNSAEEESIPPAYEKIFQSNASAVSLLLRYSRSFVVHSGCDLDAAKREVEGLYWSKEMHRLRTILDWYFLGVEMFTWDMTAKLVDQARL